MNTVSSETPAAGASARNPVNRANGSDELSRVKRELLKAEVKLARARATVVTTEIDLRMLSGRLKELAK